jgi:Fe-S-cluster containining protein
MTEEFDVENQPGNPRLMDTFEQYVGRLKRFVTKTQWPPGTKFDCVGCGDCCTWHFYKFKAPADLGDELRSHLREPHGWWVLVDEGLRLTMLLEGGETFWFKGKLPPAHLEFHKVTGRHHGYWVLNKEGMIVCYSPVSCIHLNDEMRCDIYEDRPRVCRMYYCGKYPILPEEVRG